MSELMRQMYLQSKITDSGNPVVEHLLAESGEDPARIAREIATARWSDDSTFGDTWRDFIPFAVRSVWEKLPAEAQVIAYLMASIQHERTFD